MTAASVASWGPPNHAAHTAGRVAHGDEPLTAPEPALRPRPWLTPTPQPQDQLHGYLNAYGRALGDGWSVVAWKEPQRWRTGIRGRHECGFAMEVHVDDDPGLDAIGLVRRLGSELLAKERRHSCEAIAARLS